MNIIGRLINAKAAGAPLISVTTPDPESLISRYRREATETWKAGILSWDAATGMRNVYGVPQGTLDNIKKNNKGGTAGAFVAMATTMPESSTIFIHNPHLIWEKEPSIQQAFLSIRDEMRGKGITIICLTSQTTLPEALQNHFLTFREKMPTRLQLREMVDDFIRLQTQEITPEGITSEKDRELAVSALMGSSFFVAENIFAMSWTRTTGVIDFGELWERKIEAITQNKGLGIMRSDTELDSIIGHDNAKKRLRTLVKTGRVKVIILMDEIEKMFGDDQSGVTGALIGKWLSWTAGKKVIGMLLAGTPGAGKSTLAEGAANEAGIPLTTLNINDAKGRFVGDSEESLQRCFDVVEAYGAGDDGEIEEGAILIIATANNTEMLTGEIERRLSYLRIFCEEPAAAERKNIWNHYLRYYDLDNKEDRPDDDNWTGAEIRQCCLKAHLEKISLVEAAESIIPVLVSHADQLNGMKARASGKFISSATPGPYKYTPDNPKPPKRRKMTDL